MSFIADDSTQDSNSSTSVQLTQSASEMESVSQSAESMEAQSNEYSPDKASSTCKIIMLEIYTLCIIQLIRAVNQGITISSNEGFCD